MKQNIQYTQSKGIYQIMENKIPLFPTYEHYTTSVDKNQVKNSYMDEIALEDPTEQGKDRPWAKNKKLSSTMAAAYELAGLHEKGMRMIMCASSLLFGLKQDGGKKLIGANFCRIRLCPMCQWRRALRTQSQMNKIFDCLDSREYGLLMWTSTIKNVKLDNLGEAIDTLSMGMKFMLDYKDVKKIVLGAYRAIEITYNEKTDTYHPHVHAIFVVPRSYFSSRNYLNKQQWIQLWRKACRVDYDPSISVNRIKIKDNQSINDAVREVCKYTTKAEQILEHSHGIEAIAERVKALDAILHKRRFVTLSGILKELHKKLEMDYLDDDNADLIGAKEGEQYTDKILYVWYRQGLNYFSYRPEDAE